MAQRKQTRRQHVVSKFYLRRFADSAGQLTRTELPGNRSHGISIENATVVKDFYSVTDNSGEISDFFEREFAALEGVAAEGFERMLDQGVWPLQGDDRLSVAMWIALQYLRSESVRLSQTEMNAQMIRLVVGISGKAALRRHIESKEGRAISAARLDAEWRDLTGPGGPKIAPEPREHIRLLYQLVAPTAQMLTDRQWSLTIFTRKALLTCDNPVSLHVAPGYPERMGVGLATADAYLVPVSRRSSLMIGASPDLPDMRVPGSAALAQGINSYTINNARRSLYWHPDDSEQLRNCPMPEPRERFTDDAMSDHLISEEGLFAKATDSEKKAMSSASAAMTGGEDKGFSLQDLPWPIPGRNFEYSSDD